MRRTLLAISAAAALLAGACGSSDHDATAHNVVSSTSVTTSVPATTTTTAPAPTTTRAPTTTLPNTAVVPDKITVPYVDAVLAKLNHIYGNAVRSTVAAKKLTPEAIQDLDAIYSVDLGREEQQTFTETVSGGLGNIRRHPGDPIMRVKKLVFSSSTCIYASVDTDSDPALVHPVPPLPDEFIGLRRASIGRKLDPTPWIFFFDITNKVKTTVPNQC
jgi:hypothetical protein